MQILSLSFFFFALMASMFVIWQMIAANLDKVVMALRGPQRAEVCMNFAPQRRVDRDMRDFKPRRATDRSASQGLPLAA